MDTTKPELGSIEETQRLAALGNSLYGTNAFNTQTGAPITSEALSSNQTPVSLPSVPVSTVASGISGISEVVKEQTQAQLAEEQEREAQEAKAAVGEDKGKVQTLMDRILGVQESRTTLEKEAGLDTKAQRVTNYTNQLEGLERGETNELRALDGLGLTPIQKQQRQSEINRRYAFQKADVALLQSAANRDYETAFNIVNRKIELQLEPLKTALDFTKYFYEDNKANLTKAEDRAFQSRVKLLDQQYQTEREARTAIANITLEALKNGVTIPASVLSQLDKAKDSAEATRILAANGISLENPLDRAYKLAQTNKLIAESTPNGNVSITELDANGKPVVTARSQALQVILGSGTFTKDQRATITNAINNGQDAFSVIKNQAKNVMGQTLATDLSKSETALSQLRSIDALIDQYYASGGSTGLFTGSYEKTVNKLGQVKDPRLVGIATELALAMQEYRLAVTGTAASVQEDTRIDNVFPGISNSKGLNDARTSALLKSFEQKVDAGYRSVLGSTYDSLKDGETGASNDDPLNLGFPAGTLANPLGI